MRFTPTPNIVEGRAPSARSPVSTEQSDLWRLHSIASSANPGGTHHNWENHHRSTDVGSSRLNVQLL